MHAGRSSERHAPRRGQRRSRALGALVETERDRAPSTQLEQHVDDESFSVVARRRSPRAEALGDARLLPALDRLAEQAFDGRVRRDAMEAAMRIRKGAKVPAQVTALRDDIDELREEQRRLQEKIEAVARP